MAYFQNRQPEEPHRQVFNAPIPQDDPYAEDEEEEMNLTPEELRELDEQERRDGRYRLMSGVFNLIGVVLGTLAILGVIALLISMVIWVANDMSQSFTLFQSWFS